MIHDLSVCSYYCINTFFFKLCFKSETNQIFIYCFILQILSLPGQVLNASKLLLVNGDWTRKVVLEYSMHLIFKEKILNMNFLTCAGNVINVPYCLSKPKTFLVWLCWLSFGVIKFYFLLLPVPLCFLTKPTCCKNLSKMTSYMLHITHHTFTCSWN
jgi:Na+/pantothenate symporter